ncbi:hypothetical protein T10_1194 [Trichinella papuae]|uniref:Protein quiver n=1 Tax=Trichinella papuae TaxID=268474 RepID=A0A0V1MNS5_9BILA|nr:hypothetical protein T10_1194 [Trichinella papuae]
MHIPECRKYPTVVVYEFYVGQLLVSSQHLLECFNRNCQFYVWQRMVNRKSDLLLNMTVARQSRMFSIIFGLLSVVLLSVCVDGSDTNGKTIFCFHCNSVIDEDCGDSFEIEKARKKYLVNCSDLLYKPPHLPNVQPIGCRKVDQYILDTKRVIRQCAFYGENVTDLKRPGNKGVVSYHTQCAQSECNKAVSLHSAFTTLITIAVAVFMHH